MAGDLIKLGGLWVNKKPDGSKFFTGNFGMARVVIFPNGHKIPGSNGPDYIMYISPQQKPQVDDVDDASESDDSPGASRD